MIRSQRTRSRSRRPPGGCSWYEATTPAANAAAVHDRSRTEAATAGHRSGDHPIAPIPARGSQRGRSVKTRGAHRLRRRPTMAEGASSSSHPRNDCESVSTSHSAVSRHGTVAPRAVHELEKTFSTTSRAARCARRRAAAPPRTTTEPCSSPRSASPAVRASTATPPLSLLSTCNPHSGRDAPHLAPCSRGARPGRRCCAPAAGPAHGSICLASGS